MTRSAAWSHLELGPKPLLSVTSSLTHFPRCYLPVGNWEVSFLWPWIGFISSELGSECENVSYSPKRLDPWGTIHTAQVSTPPHVLWRQKWCITEGTSGEMLNWRRSWCVVGSGRWSQQDTTAWLVKQQKCIYLITVLEAGKSMINVLARCLQDLIVRPLLLTFWPWLPHCVLTWAFQLHEHPERGRKRCLILFS